MKTTKIRTEKNNGKLLKNQRIRRNNITNPPFSTSREEEKTG